MMITDAGDEIADTSLCSQPNLTDPDKVTDRDAPNPECHSSQNVNVKDEPVDGAGELLLDDELRMQIERSIDIVVNEFSLESGKSTTPDLNCGQSDGAGSVVQESSQPDLANTSSTTESPTAVDEPRTSSTVAPSNVVEEPHRYSDECPSPAESSASLLDDLLEVDKMPNHAQPTSTTFSSSISDSVTVTKVAKDVKKAKELGNLVKTEPLEYGTKEGISNNGAKSSRPRESIYHVEAPMPRQKLQATMSSPTATSNVDVKPRHLVTNGFSKMSANEFSPSPATAVKPTSAKSFPTRLTNSSTNACQVSTKAYSKSVPPQNQGTAPSCCVGSSSFDSLSLIGGGLNSEDTHARLLPECCDGKTANHRSSCYLSVNQSDGFSNCVLRKSSGVPGFSNPTSPFLPYSADYFYRKPAPSCPRAPVFGAPGTTRPFSSTSAIEFPAYGSSRHGSNFQGSVDSPPGTDRFKPSVPTSAAHYYRSSSSSVPAYVPSKPSNPVAGSVIYNPAADPLGRMRSNSSMLNSPTARSSLVNWNTPSCMFQSSTAQASFNFSLPHARISSVSKLIRSDSSNSMSLYSDTTNVSIPTFNASYQMKSQNVTISKNSIFPRFPFRPPLPKSQYCFPSQIPCFNSCCKDTQQQFSMV